VLAPIERQADGEVNKQSRPPIEESDMKAFCRLGVVAFVFVALSPLVDGAITSGSKVKIKTEATKIDSDGKQTVTLYLDIDKGWHLYANPVGQKDLEPAQTVVTVKAGTALKDVNIEYPGGKVIKDKDLGDYCIYEEKVVIKLHVVRTAGDSSPLEVSMDIQASGGNCLFPSTVKLTVK
jgi:DsbC/DsbD-like thiol-disulfide interchange protein